MAKFKLKITSAEALKEQYPHLVKEVTKLEVDRPALYKVVRSLKHIAVAKGEEFILPGVEVITSEKDKNQVDLEDLVAESEAEGENLNAGDEAPLGKTQTETVKKKPPFSNKKSSKKKAA